MDLVEIAKAANPAVMGALREMGLEGAAAASGASGPRMVARTPVNATDGLKRKLADAEMRAKKSRSSEAASRLYAMQTGPTPRRLMYDKDRMPPPSTGQPFSRIRDRSVFGRMY